MFDEACILISLADSAPVASLCVKQISDVPNGAALVGNIRERQHEYSISLKSYMYLCMSANTLPCRRRDKKSFITRLAFHSLSFLMYRFIITLGSDRVKITSIRRYSCGLQQMAVLPHLKVVLEMLPRQAVHHQMEVPYQEVHDLAGTAAQTCSSFVSSRRKCKTRSALARAQLR